MLAEVTVPPGNVIEILPVLPAPTVAVITVSDTTVYEPAVVPPMLTDNAPVKPLPFIVIMLSVLALDGENEPMPGDAAVAE